MVTHLLNQMKEMQMKRILWQNFLAETPCSQAYRRIPFLALLVRLLQHNADNQQSWMQRTRKDDGKASNEGGALSEERDDKSEGYR
ncbi:hypothetical protein CCACVL1_02964 [Corchorus capsularis]|uniref:Uncharacterized protein n=1 Tax=Corchorus capsularis TaxID=210143 RepID=A0A1R3K4F2_COCAP|nr:hypothetical protein CCACVL1_02964 [Corchorus capsularis]